MSIREDVAAREGHVAPARRGAVRICGDPTAEGVARVLHLYHAARAVRVGSLDNGACLAEFDARRKIHDGIRGESHRGERLGIRDLSGSGLLRRLRHRDQAQKRNRGNDSLHATSLACKRTALKFPAAGLGGDHKRKSETPPFFRCPRVPPPPPLVKWSCRQGRTAFRMMLTWFPQGGAARRAREEGTR